MTKTTKKVLEMPKKMSVFVDAKSGVHTVALPIVFPDGSDGAVLITRLKKQDWNPGETIKSVTIEYYEQDKN
jgi:hypothetical protein